MNSTGTPHFLPGVPKDHVLARLKVAGGKELEGKFESPESSAALAVNTFGWFIGRANDLPPLPGMRSKDDPTCVEVEYCARFPWRGGRHPWLDAIVETEHQMIGVESKRFEPSRGHKAATFSKAYDRPVWGDHMSPYEAMRDALRSGEQRFELLDAAQLVKHAFGLVTDARRKAKTPSLVYLFAEPAAFGEHPIAPETFATHRAEIVQFAKSVEGAEVTFHAISYREWLGTWPAPPDPAGLHRDAVMQHFQP